MANPLKGDVDLVSDGVTYTLCFTSNGIVEVENVLGGLSIGEIAMQASRIEYQRALLWGALQKHHPGTDLAKAGDVLDGCEGGLAEVEEQVTRALRFRLQRIAVDAPLRPDGEV
jgi:hypothetical protein